MGVIGEREHEVVFPMRLEETFRQWALQQALRIRVESAAERCLDKHKLGHT